MVFARQSRSPSSRLTQIADPQAEPGGHQDHRVVAFAGGGLAVDHGQQPPDLLSSPQVRLGLVAHVPVRRQPVGQALRCPARGGQEDQEVRQARPHSRDGLAAQPALPQKETRHVPHAEGGQVIDTHVVQVAQEPADRLVLRSHGRLGVAARAARGNVVVSERTEPGGTAVLGRDHRLVDRRPPGRPARPPSAPPAGGPPGHPCPRPTPATPPAWSRSGSATKSTHTWSLAVSRPRPARKAANRSSTTWWRRIVPSRPPSLA